MSLSARHWLTTSTTTTRIKRTDAPSAMATNVRLTDRQAPSRPAEKPTVRSTRRSKVTAGITRPTRRLPRRPEGRASSPTATAAALSARESSTVPSHLPSARREAHSCFQPPEAASSAQSRSAIPLKAARRNCHAARYSFVAGTCPSGKYPTKPHKKSMQKPLFEQRATEPPITHTSLSADDRAARGRRRRPDEQRGGGGGGGTAR
uniref:Uncharacterized protein n=1 Tax=Plectus sambesii TaxID=2011161 RepID=A0A914UY21_9BILA